MALCYEPGFGCPTITLDRGRLLGLLKDEEKGQIVMLIRYYQIHETDDTSTLPPELAGRNESLLREHAEKDSFKALLAKGSGKRELTDDYVAFLKKKLYLVSFLGTYEPSYTEKQLDQVRKKKMTLEEFQRKFSPLPRRKQAAVVLNGLVACDFDHLFGGCNALAVRQWWDDWYAHTYTPLSEKGEVPDILMTYISARADGVKIIFKAREDWGNLIDNQLRFAQVVGHPVDEQCKDGARGQFLTTMDDVLLMKDELFDYFNQAYSEKFTPLYRGGKNQPSLFPELGKKAVTARGEGSAEVESDDVGEDYLTDGISTSEIIREIVGDVDPNDHKRHHYALKLASYLRYIVGRDERDVRKALLTQAWFRSLEKENRTESDRCLADGMRYEMNINYPRELDEAIRRIKARNQKLAPQGAGEDGGRKADELPFEEWGAAIGRFAEVYPCLKECLMGLESRQYAAGLFVSAAFFGTLMTRCYYHFYHHPSEKRRLNYCIYIIGDPGCGKSFGTRLYRLIASPILAADEVSNMQINNYKKATLENNSKKDSKKGDGVQKPQVVVRCHGVRTSNSVFIEDMVNAVDDNLPEPLHLHLLTFDAELDSLAFANRGGQFIDKTTFELKAFHNETDNQNYKNLDSVTGPFDVFWNYVYTGTPLALDRKIKPANFGSGLATRLAVIPMATTKYKMMPFKQVEKSDEEAEQFIKDWATKLDKVAGDLNCWDLVRHVYDWCAEKMTCAGINQDDVVEMLCKRVPYYGIHITIPFIMMRHWNEWQAERKLTLDEIDYDFATLVMNIQYDCQIHFFGKYAQAYFDNQLQDASDKQYTEQDKTVAYFNGMKDQFTFADLEQYTRLSYQGVASIIKRWVDKGVITKNGKGKKAILKKVK